METLGSMGGSRASGKLRLTIAITRTIYCMYVVKQNYCISVYKRFRYMTERGLEWSKDYSSKDQPKEPKSGFQVGLLYSSFTF